MKGVRSTSAASVKWLPYVGRSVGGPDAEPCFLLGSFLGGRCGSCMQVRDRATSVPAGYAPVAFKSKALQHTCPQLTWDADDPDRARALSAAAAAPPAALAMPRKGKGKPSAEDLNEDNLRAYLASDSGGSSSEEGSGGDGAPRGGSRLDAIEAARTRCVIPEGSASRTGLAGACRLPVAGPRFCGRPGLCLGGVSSEGSGDGAGMRAWQPGSAATARNGASRGRTAATRATAMLPARRPTNRRRTTRWTCKYSPPCLAIAPFRSADSYCPVCARAIMLAATRCSMHCCGWQTLASGSRRRVLMLLFSMHCQAAAIRLLCPCGQAIVAAILTC